MIGRLQKDGSISLLAAFLGTGALALYVKWVLLQSGGLLTAARFLGKSSTKELTLLERVAFFGSDFAIHMIAIPVCAVLLLRMMPPRPRAICAIVVNVALCTLLVIDLGALGNVGRFLSWPMARDAMLWAKDNPDSVRDYLNVAHVIGGAALLAFVVVVVRAANVPLERASRLVRFTRSWLGRGAIALVVASCALVGIAWSSGLPPLAQRASVLVQMLDALRRDTARAEWDESTSADALSAAYRELAKLPPAPRSASDAYAGKDRDHDVILFVLETAPRRAASFVQRSGAGSGLPAIDRLRPRAFVSDRHFTTYPYTTDAVFSLLTGLYPLGRESFLRERRPLRGVGLFASLAERGYERRVYSPWPDTFEDDTSLFRLIGTSQRFIVDPKDAASYGPALARARSDLAKFPGRREPPGAVRPFDERLAHDLAALARLESDVRSFIDSDRRYAVAFFPQIGHGPWVDLVGTDQVVDRGTALIRMQDAWLGEIVQLLAERHRLDRTVIVVTGDHGVRTRAEDPALDAGRCTNYSFNVPLLVWAPGALDATLELTNRTSHVDLAPTLCDLLDAHGSGERFLQGAPLWDARLATRRQFFFADAYFGSDACADGDAWCMLQSPTDAVFASDTFDFPPPSQLSSKALTDRPDPSLPIRRMYGLQPLYLRALPREP